MHTINFKSLSYYVSFWCLRGALAVHKGIKFPQRLRCRRYETMNGFDVQIRILLFSSPKHLCLSHRSFTSPWLGTPLSPSGSVSRGSFPCVDVSSGEVPPFCCVILVSIYKLALEYSNSPPFARSAVGSAIMSITIFNRTKTSSTVCSVSGPSVWERGLSIPILISALFLTGVWLETEVGSDVCNGAIWTVDRVCAPLIFFQRDAAAPNFSLFGVETVQPSK